MAAPPLALAVLATGLRAVSAIDNGLGLSPPMGWSANNAWHWIYGQDVMESSCALVTMVADRILRLPSIGIVHSFVTTRDSIAVPRLPHHRLHCAVCTRR